MKKISLKQLILIFSLIGLILSIPSIVYLFFHGGNIESYNGQNYYFLDSNSMSHTIIGAIILAAIIILGFLIYILILKKSNEFKNIRFNVYDLSPKYYNRYFLLYGNRKTFSRIWRKSILYYDI